MANKKSWEERVAAEIVGTCAHGETADSDCDICREAEIRLEEEELIDEEDILSEEADGELDEADGQTVVDGQRNEARHHDLAQLEERYRQVQRRNELLLTLALHGKQNEQLQVN